MKILGSPASSCDFMVVASSTLCNLLLEFSPSKEPILESGAIDLLCSLTHKYEPALVLNGVWGLMVSIILDIEMRINRNIQFVGIFKYKSYIHLISEYGVSIRSENQSADHHDIGIRPNISAARGSRYTSCYEDVRPLAESVVK